MKLAFCKRRLVFSAGQYDVGITYATLFVHKMKKNFQCPLDNCFKNTFLHRIQDVSRISHIYVPETVQDKSLFDLSCFELTWIDQVISR